MKTSHDKLKTFRISELPSCGVKTGGSQTPPTFNILSISLLLLLSSPVLATDYSAILRAQTQQAQQQKQTQRNIQHILNSTRPAAIPHAQIRIRPRRNPWSVPAKARKCVVVDNQVYCK